jgi:deoxycytidine triphosphate deaminase
MGDEMSLMIDRQLQMLVAPELPKVPGKELVPPLVSATKPEIGRWDSKIQPASLDLTIGRIFLPVEGDSDDKIYEESSLSLGQGETAVVETHEYLSLPRTVAAIGFPPATVSRDGLLLTNPGHVDPGYAGRLKFTVINLGKKPIQLSSGKPICTLLFFSIPAPDYAYDQLDKMDKPASPSDLALLSRLSRDFLTFNDRIKESVKSELKSAQLSTPIISGVVALFLTIVASMIANYFSGVNELRVKIEGLEKTIAIQDVKARVEKLENKN